MRLLVTRPISDALVLAEQLARHGHDVLVSPMINIIIDPHDRAESLPATDAQGGLAFTSANGVRALMAPGAPGARPVNRQGISYGTQVPRVRWRTRRPAMLKRIAQLERMEHGLLSSSSKHAV